MASIVAPVASSPPPPPASLLTIPCELRNAIYHYIFLPCYNTTASDGTARHDKNYKSPLSHPLGPSPPHHKQPTRHRTTSLRLLQTCHQIHSEATILAYAHTSFHLSGTAPHPPYFDQLTSTLRQQKIAAIRHITLTTRIASLRAMNESWDGLPFAHPSLRLETLTIIPTRADPGGSAYREVADLSQSHTLAYIFAETLKGLRNVRCVRVRNEGCFNEVVWKLVYRSTVYRMWRWGGGKCGVRFECSGEESEGTGMEWFCAWLGDEAMDAKGKSDGNEVGDEVVRLVGASGELPADPRELGMVDEE